VAPQWRKSFRSSLEMPPIGLMSAAEQSYLERETARERDREREGEGEGEGERERGRERVSE